ncbi:MAG: hypothetical protein NUV80_00025 [Candidatus Berkelbacteria bacterium]|nr:hypothetical protein [Candidatus Berkelbacteria bacterium]MCR4306938.1 hypothetical protein [Candidatus Berkelbacteria bacterium]
MSATKQTDIVNDEEIRELVKARLQTFPSGKKISIGSDGEFSKEDLIRAVSEKTDLGQKIINIQLDYLRALKHGALLTQING